MYPSRMFPVVRNPGFPEVIVTLSVPCITQVLLKLLCASLQFFEMAVKLNLLSDFSFSVMKVPEGHRTCSKHPLSIPVHTWDRMYLVTRISIRAMIHEPRDGSLKLVVSGHAYPQLVPYRILDASLESSQGVLIPVQILR